MSELRYFAARVLRSHSDERAAEHWRALLAGRWQLIDCFDADGRRYLIARHAGDTDALSPDEQLLIVRRARGDALKAIAIDLGLSISTISRRLTRAMHKLGVRSEVELPRLFVAFDS